MFKDDYKYVAEILIANLKINISKGKNEFISNGLPTAYNCDFNLLFSYLKSEGYTVQTRNKHRYWGFDIRITKYIPSNKPLYTDNDLN